MSKFKDLLETADEAIPYFDPDKVVGKLCIFGNVEAQVRNTQNGMAHCAACSFVVALDEEGELFAQPWYDVHVFRKHLRLQLGSGSTKIGRIIERPKSELRGKESASALEMTVKKSDMKRAVDWLDLNATRSKDGKIVLNFEPSDDDGRKEAVSESDEDGEMWND